MINRIYKESAPTDTLALNQVRSSLQERIVDWQRDFDRLPKPRPLAEKNPRKVSAFTSVRAMWPRRQDLANAFEHLHAAPSSVSEVEDVRSRLKMRRITGDSLASSSASETELKSDRPLKAEDGNSEHEPEYGQLSPTTAEPPSTSTESQAAKSDPESDSTIGAAKDDPLSPSLGSLDVRATRIDTCTPLT
jgi:1-phosphatidylinositol-3-phosphate 5-kinase